MLDRNQTYGGAYTRLRAEAGSLFGARERLLCPNGLVPARACLRQSLDLWANLSSLSLESDFPELVIAMDFSRAPFDSFSLTLVFEQTCHAVLLSLVAETLFD